MVAPHATNGTQGQSPPENAQATPPVAAASTFQFSRDLLTHYRQLSQRSLTVVDVETTGYTPQTSRMIEIAVVQASLTTGITWQQADLLNPGVTVPNRITRFTGISAAMVAAAADIATVLPNYLPYLDNGVLTAHNLSFDYSFLQAEYQQLGHPFARSPQDQLCTVQLARLMLADLPSRSLPKLVEHFQFPITTSHRALADAEACWLLAQRLLTELNDQDDDTLIARFGQEWVPIQAIYPLFGRSRLAAQKFLAERGVPTRSSRRRRAPMYRRGELERLYTLIQAGNRTGMD